MCWKDKDYCAHAISSCNIVLINIMILQLVTASMLCIAVLVYHVVVVVFVVNKIVYVLDPY